MCPPPWLPACWKPSEEEEQQPGPGLCIRGVGEGAGERGRTGETDLSARQLEKDAAKLPERGQGDKQARAVRSTARDQSRGWEDAVSSSERADGGAPLCAAVPQVTAASPRTPRTVHHSRVRSRAGALSGSGWHWAGVPPNTSLPQYLCSRTDGSGDVHVLIALAGLGAERTMVSAGTESQQ